MSVGRICSRVVVTASPGENARAAARRMADNEVGTLVIIDGGRPRQAAGVLTDRDIAIRCVADGLDPDETPISDLMSSPVQCVDEHTPIEDAVGRMARAGIRRLVVMGEDNNMAGLLSLDDVLEVIVGETAAIGRLLERQKPRVLA